jgi:glycerophosphoryl diester phosphodiesterase
MSFQGIFQSPMGHRLPALLLMSALIGCASAPPPARETVAPRPTTPAATSPPLVTPPAPPAIELQGHRGARGLAPENTLTAFARALDIGVDTLELDVGVTRDGVVVVSHDPKLNVNFTRDAQGRWLEGTHGPAIRDLTLAQVRAYDVGRIKPETRYAQTFASQQAVDGERIPTLAAVFELVRSRRADRVRFNIETKINPDDAGATVPPADFVRALLNVIDAHGMRGRVTIQSFDWRTLREAKRVAPDVPTACLTVRQNWMDNVGANGRWTDGITLAEHGGVVPRMVKAASCSTWSPYFGEADAAQIAEARRLGLKTIVWTVNNQADIDRMIALRVDGIISDYPDRVKASLARVWSAQPLR